MSTERIIVQRAVADDFRNLLVDFATTAYGERAQAPVLISPVAAQRNRNLVRDALQNGADIIFGDINAKDSSTSSIRPLIVGKVNNSMKLYREESFGPLVTLIVVNGEEEAI
jgi:acyl-CoA reductase-like NAD-dependent aldehyde dehydrogenase